MSIKKKISTASLLAAASLTLSPAAWSLGLGDITVESFLNQPLRVKVDLISRETDDLTSVTAKLASADDYELIGSSREMIPVPIRFSVEDIEGDAFLLGTSNLPVGSPVVRLIVEVNWSAGRLLREYTVFLDPATVAEAAPIPRTDLRASPPAPMPEPEPAAEAPPAPDTAPAKPQPEAREETPASRPASAVPPVEGEYGPVRNGQTLWGIASNWAQGRGLEINKVMIAIQRENPEAFLRGNINLLKRGAILRMPRMDDVRSLDTAAVINEVREQEAAFRGRAPAASVTSPETPLLAEEAAAPELRESAPEPEPAQPASAAEPEAPAAESDMAADAGQADEPVAEAVQAEVRDQLELVPPSEQSELDSAYGFEEAEEPGADASVAVSTLREELARTEEELIAQQQQNEYLADRIQELESQLVAAEEDKVADADLANMEERLRQERLAREAAERSAAQQPWYRSFWIWLIGLLVVAAAAIGWFMSRRGGTEEALLAAGEEEKIREIKDEAEEVLRVLDDAEDADDEEAEVEAEESVEEAREKARDFDTFGEDAEVLDEESSDPEIQLDLARAYISMGDKEAARVILEEVQTNGNEEQQEEAKKMLDLLAP